MKRFYLSLLFFISFFNYANEFNPNYFTGQWGVKSDKVDCASIHKDIEAQVSKKFAHCQIDGNVFFTQKNLTVVSKLKLDLINNSKFNFNLPAIRFNISSNGAWDLKSQNSLLINLNDLDISSSFSVFDNQINEAVPQNITALLNITYINKDTFKATLKDYKIEVIFTRIAEFS